MFEDNQHYSIWRQSGGNAELLACKTPADLTKIMNNVWQRSVAEWTRQDKADRSNRRSMVSEVGKINI